MQTADFAHLRAACQSLPTRPTAFVLGSGMGPILDRVAVRISTPFASIPGMVAPSVSGHGGSLILGEWADQPVLVFSGRLHYYEGLPWERVVRPMEVLQELGARAVILTNASGGINPAFAPGSLMLVTDHLEWNHPFHWRSPGPGQRPSPYNAGLIAALRRAARAAHIGIHAGIYAVVTGPTYETPAEVRALGMCGADAVGMSTAAEAKRAFELGLPVAAVSCIANCASGLSATPLSHVEVLSAVAASADSMGRMFTAFMLENAP